MTIVSLALAQGVGQISGKVMDGESGRPIPFASIYFNSTSIGTIADSVGNYTLKNIPIHYTDLVFSSIGYEPFFYKVSLTNGRTVAVVPKLRPSKRLLNEIVVKGKRDRRWKENYDRFIKEFIGNGPNATQCEIENPEILNFSSSDDLLKATANRPLELVNRALGYKIWVTLVLFQLTSENYRIVVYTRFQSLIPKNEREEFRWQVNRSHTYKGSERHFLKSLIDKRSESEGFRVYEKITAKFKNGSQVVVKPNKEVSQDLLFPQLPTNGKPEGYYKLLKKGVFEIHYLNQFTPKSKRVYPDFPHPVSWLEVSDDYLLSPFTGIIRSNASAMISGEMGKHRLADILPEDYDPIPDEGKIYLAKHAVELGTIRGTTIDSMSGRPLANAFVFINNSLYNVNADYKGQFELKNIPQGTYSIVGTYGQYCAESQKIDVRSDSISTVNFRLPVKVFEPWEEPLTYQGNSTDDLKRMYFAQHFWNWHDFSTYSLNLSALEIKFLENKILMRTNSPLEIVDHKTGYMVRYFLKASEIPRSRKGQSTIHGFASFDTLSAKSFEERKKWLENRDDYYQGTVSHFIKSLAEGRSQEENFKIYTLRPKTKGKPGKGSRRGTPEPLAGDSLLTRGKSSTFALTLPENTFVRFDGGKATKMEGDHLFVSSQGFLFDQGQLKLQGPMKTKAIPILPIEYVSSTEAISDPRVWVFIKDSELNSLQQMVEKTFLHTDKDYYYPGEKIWYKAYLRYGSKQLRDSLSKVLHVELIDPDKKVIRNEMLKIDQGMTWGDISLPDTLKQGTYFLRAYTRWAVNFGSESVFLKPIPVLATNQNIEQDKTKIKQASMPQAIIKAGKTIYKPRDKIILNINVADDVGHPVNSNLSISVTDADKVSSGQWSKTIMEDSLPKREKWKYKRVLYPIEKEFSYNCYVRKEFTDNPASVVISSVTGKQTVFALPGKDARFKFRADFFDTASFIFRASVKSGYFAGHVFIEKPATLPIPLSLVPPDFSLRDDDAKYRIKYAYDPNEKTTMLEEVVIRGSRIIDPPKKINTSSIMMTPDHIYEAKDLNPITQSIQDPTSFWQIMVDLIPGARPDPDNIIRLRRQPAGFRVNNIPFGAEDIKILNPADIDRIEIYNLLALVNIYLKTGPDKVSKVNEVDRYTLSGYAMPSTFYMRDYSKNSPDNELPDFRTTIYWKPDVVIDGDETTVSFYAADLPAKYRIVVEGLTADGQPVYGEQIIEVRE